jgi:hypothetical protein
MSMEHGVADATVRIRTQRVAWMGLLVAGPVWFLAALIPLLGPDRGSNPFPLFLSLMFVGEAFLIRSFGIDLTPQSAMVRGLRRRSVPWSQVQAVLRYQQLGCDRVTLVLEDGQRLNLRTPATFWGSGAATAHRYEQDFHQIGQWWLAHRGPSWRPVRPEAPQTLTQ